MYSLTPHRALEGYHTVRKRRQLAKPSAGFPVVQNAT
jgi:hypothetical protein